MPAVRKSTTQRGLGWQHQKQREALMGTHYDGAPCWWCGQPMYRDKTRNFDGQPLHADHVKSRADGGTVARRLLHGSCNAARGDGSRDHERPALKGLDLAHQRPCSDTPTARLEAVPGLSAAADYDAPAVYDWPDPPG